jgi:hypothetical protein
MLLLFDYPLSLLMALQPSAVTGIPTTLALSLVGGTRTSSSDC